ncbi:helix-turn-helix domain-containing protein [Desulfohalobium retbaense]|uniref:Uncharacterized protein n=1 Tax=Desulfohalobium retbaense (strain ATCC 49708 / DSM 5692 / JCM 16813 / HR100) TaxID=485915 RepID=C8X5U1_DESRD|nr:helix-turn-helix domain-containing protein [Desulfohalobium retbaense]ACV69788.1 hypothetical protein Dret_2507 [Desulfohalobium retbaense DSM 5692]
MAKKKRRSLYDTLSARDSGQDDELRETFKRVREINTKQSTETTPPSENSNKKVQAQDKSPSGPLIHTAQTNRSNIPITHSDQQSNNKENNKSKQEFNKDSLGDTNRSPKAPTNTAQNNRSSKALANTAQVDRPNKPLENNHTAHLNSSNEPFTRALRAQSLSGTNERYAQAVQMSGSEESHEPTEDPQNILLKPKSSIRSRNQKKIFDYLQRIGSQTTTLTYISNITGVPYSTTRRIISKFKAEGLIYYRTLFVKDVGWCAKIWIINSEGETPNRAVQMSGINGRYEWAVSNASKIDRESIYLKEGGVGGDGQDQPDNSSSSSEARLNQLTDEDIAFFWPKLHQSGFGAHQVQQIVQRLSKVDKKADKVIQGLDHAEWELDQGKMTDKEGNPVGNPCSYVFSSLAREGYYRRPSGYISPEEQAELDAKEEADRLQQLGKEKKESQFKAWKANLSEEELNQILACKTHKGPTDPWLRQYWEKTIYYTTK